VDSTVLEYYTDKNGVVDREALGEALGIDLLNAG